MSSRANVRLIVRDVFVILPTLELVVVVATLVESGDAKVLITKDSLANNSNQTCEDGD